MKAMAEVNVKINPTQSAKKQALEFIKDLQKVIPIDRAKMRIKVIFTAPSQGSKLQEELVASAHKPGEDFIVDKDNDRFLELMI